MKTLMPDLPATPIDLSGPRLRNNHKGYRLGDEIIDGFPDRPQLPPFQRQLIAEWADAFGHELSAVQQELLRVRPGPTKVQREIFEAAYRDGEYDVQRLGESGVYDALDPADIDRCELPHSVLGRDRGYPVNATELAVLARVSYKQVRDWDKAGLLPSHVIDGRRQYLTAAALMACALRPLDRWQIAALRGILCAERDSGFRRLVDYVSDDSAAASIS
jgi:hypothetical protein